MLQGSFLDVAIGLIFTFALLSLVTTSITEGAANLLRRRSRALGVWIEHMLGDAADANQRKIADAVLSHPLIHSLCPPNQKRPDYIPSEVFVMVLFETLAPDSTKRPRSFAELRAVIEGLGEGPLRQALSNLCLNPQDDLATAEHAVADWFDGAMQRLSGWYGRRSQLAAFGFATMLTCSLNADALMIADALWEDDGLRATVVEQASATASELARENQPDSSENAEPSEDPGVDAAVSTLRELDAFPLGWASSDAPLDRRRPPHGCLAWLTKLLGLGVTVLAITLGAPFWFDLLSRVVGLRSAGKRPPTNRELRADS